MSERSHRFARLLGGAWLALVVGCGDETQSPCGDDDCVTPGLPVCERSLVVTYFPFGTCENGVCDWERRLTPCPYGCVDGACLEAESVCTSACTSPPESYCDGSALVFYARTGLCDGVTGECRYSESRADCAANDRVCSFDLDALAGCREPSAECGNGRLDEGESDVDCGGVCTPCEAGAVCAVDEHCTSRQCEGGRCASADCNDGIRNGLESDVDCGGTDCDACGDGGLCVTDLECTTGMCVRGACAPVTCINAALDGLETDVDCGGVCDPCEDNHPCAVATDCTSGVCDGDRCAAPSCEDGVRNGFEIATDCGGACPACAD
jgi:hypothetical protein